MLDALPANVVALPRAHPLETMAGGKLRESADRGVDFLFCVVCAPCLVNAACLRLAAPPASSSAANALERRVTTGSHTIILVQLLPESTSRTFHDFESLDGALDGEDPSLGALCRPASQPLMGNPPPMQPIRRCNQDV